MIVNLPNGKKYFMEKALCEKLDLMINRMEKGTDDNLIIIDGDEGQGKSNLLSAIAGYVHTNTERELSLDNLFFDLDALIKFAIGTKKQIILWDEGALGGLAAEWWRKNQIKFVKLLMVARKKKHFIAICIPKFFKLNEYLVVDRSIALLHVYSRGNLQKGRFVYFSKVKKEKLYQDWKSSRKRNYKKYVTIRGSFPIALPKVFDEDEYERRKDIAIMSIDEGDKVSKTQERLDKWEVKTMEFMKSRELTREFCEHMGFTTRNGNKKINKVVNLDTPITQNQELRTNINTLGIPMMDTTTSQRVMDIPD